MDSQNHIQRFAYYLTESTLNLNAISRTVSKGTVDVSSSDISTAKANCLALACLNNLDKEDLKAKVSDNFRKAIGFIYKLAAKEKPFKCKNDVRELLKSIAIMLGEGILNRECWLRNFDSTTFPYTKVIHLEEALDDFCGKFYEIINAMPSLELERAQWSKKVGAWIEYRINFTDHFISDGCGKTSLVFTTFVFILAQQRMPVFLTHEDYFHKQALPKMRSESDCFLDQDEQFNVWYQYYCQRFI